MNLFSIFFFFFFFWFFFDLGILYNLFTQPTENSFLMDHVYLSICVFLYLIHQLIICDCRFLN